MSDDFEAKARAAFVGEAEQMLAQLKADRLGISVRRENQCSHGLGGGMAGRVGLRCLPRRPRANRTVATTAAF